MNAPTVLVGISGIIANGPAHRSALGNIDEGRLENAAFDAVSIIEKGKPAFLCAKNESGVRYMNGCVSRIRRALSVSRLC
jgi:hypothetical protein